MWHIAGNNPLAGDVVGAEGIVPRMLRFGEASNNTLRLATTMVATATHAVAIHEARHQSGTGIRGARDRCVHVRDGLVHEFWSFSEDHEATDRMWR